MPPPRKRLTHLRPRHLRQKSLRRKNLRSSNPRPSRSAWRKPRGRPQPMARLAKAGVAGVAAEVGAVGAPATTRPCPPRRSRQKKTKPERSAKPPKALLRASADGGVVGDGRARSPLRPRTTRRTPLLEYASPAVKKQTAKSLASTDPPGWRPSASGDAKVGRPVGVARRS